MSVKLGIIGANAERGWARDAHIPALQGIDGIEIAAVSARTRAIADAAAAQFGAAAFDDSIAMTRSPEIDMVSVTVKVPEHRALVLSALEAGKHVYCEWPLGRDLAEAEEMASLARRQGVHVMVGLQGTVAPAVRSAVEIVRHGDIGEPMILRVFSPTAGWGDRVPEFYAYLSDRKNGATLATIAGGHTLAVMAALAGAFREVDARASILQPEVGILDSDEMFERTCADHLLVLGKHDSGCVSTLEVAGGQPPSTPFELELSGSKGRINLFSNFPGGFQAGDITLTLNGEVVLVKSEASQLKGPPANVGELYKRFLGDIRSGSHTVPNFEDAVELTRLLDTIECASGEGVRQFMTG